MAEIVRTSCTETSITARVEGMNGSYNETIKRKVSWTIDGANQGKVFTISNNSSVSPTTTFKNLEPGTSYYIGAHITFDNGSIDIFADLSTKEPTLTGSIDITDTTRNSISARLINMNSSYPSSRRIRITWYIAGNEKNTYTFYGGPSQTSSYTFTGLKSNTDYLIKIELKDLTSNATKSWSKWVTTDNLAEWDWYSSNGIASAS